MLDCKQDENSPASNQMVSRGGVNNPKPKKRWRRCLAEDESVVYFVECGDGGPIKVGISNNLPKRVIDMQISNPYPLKVLASFRGTEDQEASIHDVLSAHHLRGEWFTPSALSAELIGIVLRDGVAAIDEWLWRKMAVASLPPGEIEKINLQVAVLRASIASEAANA